MPSRDALCYDTFFRYWKTCKMLMNGLNHSDQAFSRDLPSDPNFATLPIQRIKYLRSLVFNGYVLLNGKGIPHDAKGKLLGNEYKAEVDRLKTKGWVYVYEWPDEDEDGIRFQGGGASNYFGLAEHMARFNPDHPWIEEENIVDYVILDFRRTEPTKIHPGVESSYHVVFDEKFTEYR
ncbi:hypothetical protein Moror_11508 [Moniliophthora roreri MCA 2997]|uniref:Uncharacterized protein n=2 Tax=Moniliophthora roreri TaxID=221103 RepID=V2WR08_MONRO|nr:hypothetical protein Moror_11508 [Moniliophthora roreri MCA 2997]